jgi:thiamine phosphate synthase YjbQ (UPF0047 family)
MMLQIDIKTHSTVEMIDITKDVQNIVEKSNIKSGLCIVLLRKTRRRFPNISGKIKGFSVKSALIQPLV